MVTTEELEDNEQKLWVLKRKHNDESIVDTEEGKKLKKVKGKGEEKEKEVEVMVIEESPNDEGEEKEEVEEEEEKEESEGEKKKHLRYARTAKGKSKGVLKAPPKVSTLFSAK